MNLVDFIPPILRAFYRSRKENFDRILELAIVDLGVSEKNLPFITLKNGVTFYGHFPTKVQRNIYRFFLDQKIKDKISKDTFNVAIDITTRYLPPQTKMQEILRSKYYDLKYGEVVIEGGAYIGYYALKASELVGPHGLVIAIEPIDENYVVLLENIKANSIKNIIPIKRAIWREKTLLKLYTTGRQAASFSNEIISQPKRELIVEADSIDNICRNIGISNVDFIRLQINGAELLALEGMNETLKWEPRMLIAAPYDFQGKSLKDAIKQWLISKGYRTEYRGRSVFAWKG